MADKEPVIEEEDDGGTVAPMNLEGMPWYHPGRPKSNSGLSEPPLTEKLSIAEKWAFFTGALKASLLVTLCFFGTFAIVILIFLAVGKG